MNRQLALEIGSSSIEALKNVFKGYEVEQVKGSFSANDFTITIRITPPGPNGVIVSRYESHFKAYATLFNLKPEDFGKTFRSLGKDFTIIGLDMKKRAYPIIAESGGKKYKFPAEDIKKLLANKEGNTTVIMH